MRWLPALMATLALAGVPRALASAEADAQLRAAFVYRFAQFTQWPRDGTGHLTLCAAGSPDTDEALRELHGRMLAGQPLRYRAVETPREAQLHCQVLVLGFKSPTQLRRWLQGLEGAPVLVVGLAPEALRAGVDIALLAGPQGLSFSVNLAEAKRRGLVMSGQMLKLAREVR